jgi:hypothetical protein
MSALSIQPTFPIFTETDGLPLENGYIWIGAANLDPQGNPINVYWDAALTIPAAQPIRTLNGYPLRNGTPARIYVNSDYSIRVQDSKGSLVYSAPEATERYGGIVTLTSLGITNVKDFGAVGDGVADDTAAIQAAIDSFPDISVSSNPGGTLYFPTGTYKVTNTLTVTRTGIFFVGASSMASVIQSTHAGTCIEVAAFQEAGSGKFSITNMKILGTAKTGTGIDCLYGMYTCTWKDVFISEFNIGLYLKDVYLNAFINLMTQDNNTGIKTLNANANNFYSGWCRDNWQLDSGSFYVSAVNFEPGNGTNRFSDAVLESCRFERITFYANNPIDFFTWVEFGNNCVANGTNIQFNSQSIPWDYMVEIIGSNNTIDFSFLSNYLKVVKFTSASYGNLVRYRAKSDATFATSQYRYQGPHLDFGVSNKVEYNYPQSLSAIDYGVDYFNRGQYRTEGFINQLSLGTIANQDLTQTLDTTEVFDPLGAKNAIKLEVSGVALCRRIRNAVLEVANGVQQYYFAFYIYLPSAGTTISSFLVGSTPGFGTTYETADFPKDRWIRIVSLDVLNAGQNVQQQLTIPDPVIGQVFYIYAEGLSKFYPADGGAPAPVNALDIVGGGTY